MSNLNTGDSSFGEVDSWQDVMGRGSTTTITNANGITPQIVNNDTTNNPISLDINDTTTGVTLDVRSTSTSKVGQMAILIDSSTSAGNQTFLLRSSRTGGAAGMLLDMNGGANALKVDHDSNGFIPSCLLYTSPSPRDATLSRMPSSA